MTTGVSFTPSSGGTRRSKRGILRERGVKPWPHKFVTMPAREFRRRYLTLEGRRDGWTGLKLAALLAFYYGFMPHWYLARPPR